MERLRGVRDEEGKTSVSRGGGEEKRGRGTGGRVEVPDARTSKQPNKRRHRSLTVADFLARHVVAGRETVLGHRHVRVEGEGQQARG